MAQNPHGKTYGAERGLSRFEGFSDAVFAIALTLLIVEIKVPGSPDGPHGYTDLAKAMAEQWREHLALILCYVVIGAYWLQHHYSGRIYAKAITGSARSTCCSSWQLWSSPTPFASGAFISARRLSRWHR